MRVKVLLFAVTATVVFGFVAETSMGQLFRFRRARCCPQPVAQCQPVATPTCCQPAPVAMSTCCQPTPMVVPSTGCCGTPMVAPMPTPCCSGQVVTNPVDGEEKKIDPVPVDPEGYCNRKHSDCLGYCSGCQGEEYTQCTNYCACAKLVCRGEGPANGCDPPPGCYNPFGNGTGF